MANMIICNYQYSSEESEPDDNDTPAEATETTKRKPFVIPNYITESESAGKTIYRCNNCQKKFKTKAHIKYHESCQTGEKKFLCQICGKGLNSKFHLEYHQRMHEGELPFHCPQCPKRFAQAGRVTRHVRSFHNHEKSHICKECGKGFAAKQSLESHALVHTGERPFTCEICAMRFTGLTGLKKHIITIHTEDRPFACMDCDKRFPLKWSLDQHVKIHLPERPFKCSQCVRAFKTSKDLNRHIHVHTGGKPFHCSICRNQFQRKDNLDRHIRNTHNKPKDVAKDKDMGNHVAATYSAKKPVHQIPIPSETGFGASECAIPDNLDHDRSKCAIPVNLDQDVKTHSPKRSFPSDQSVQEFKTSKDLTRHNTTHTGARPLQCFICAQEFQRKENLYRHIKTIHNEPKKVANDMGNHVAATLSTKMAANPTPIQSASEFNTSECAIPVNLNQDLKTHSLERPFPCGQSVREFKTSKDLIRHITTHTDGKPFQSFICTIEFRRKDNLDRNIQTIHNEPKKVTNDMVNHVAATLSTKIAANPTPIQSASGFNTSESAIPVNHVKTPSTERSFPSDQCVQEFMTSEDLRRHITTHAGIRTLQCPKCPPGVSTQKETNKETNDDTPAAATITTKNKRSSFPIPDYITKSETAGKTTYRCNICQKVFKTKVHIKYHKSCQTGTKIFSCEICGKGMNSKSHLSYHKLAKHELAHHQLEHEGIRPFQCSKCSKNFLTRGKLNRHVRSVHEKQKRHACAVCGRRFSNKQSLESHGSVHKDKQQFTCVYCGKSFAKMSGWKHHVALHSVHPSALDCRSFDCTQCDKRFTLKLNLDRHVKTHSTERRFPCTQCIRKFKTSKDLNRHILVHTAVKPFHCFICARRFGRHDNMVRHILNVHSKPKEVAKDVDTTNDVHPTPSTNSAAPIPAIGIFQKYLLECQQRANKHTTADQVK